MVQEGPRGSDPLPRGQEGASGSAPGAPCIHTVTGPQGLKLRGDVEGLHRFRGSHGEALRVPGGSGVGWKTGLTQSSWCAGNPPEGHKQKEACELPHSGVADTCLRRTCELPAAPPVPAHTGGTAGPP